MSKPTSTPSKPSSDPKASGNAAPNDPAPPAPPAGPPAGATDDEGGDPDAAAEGLRAARFKAPKPVEGSFVVLSPIKYTSAKTEKPQFAPAFRVDAKGQRHEVVVDDLSERDADHFYGLGCIKPLVK